MKNEFKKALYAVWLGMCLGFAQIDLITAIGIILGTTFLVAIRLTNPITILDEYVRNSLYAVFLGLSLGFAGIGLTSLTFWAIIIVVPGLVAYRHLILKEELEQMRREN